MLKFFVRKYSGLSTAGFAACLFLSGSGVALAQDSLAGLKAMADAMNKLHQDIEALPPGQRTNSSIIELREKDIAPARAAMNSTANKLLDSYKAEAKKVVAKLNAEERALREKAAAGASGAKPTAGSPAPVASKREQQATEVTGAGGAKSVDLLNGNKKTAEPQIKVNQDGIIE